MSFAQTYITYPRCYIRRQKSAALDNEYSEGDNELLVLWDMYMNRKTDTTTWAFRKQMLACAIRLLDGFGQWVDDQSRDPTITGYNLDFLKDTLNYINTGQRRLSPLAWLELVTEVEEVSTLQRGQQLVAGSQAKGALGTAETIQKWTAWPGGFEDLILSLYVFFGDQRHQEPPVRQRLIPVGIAD